MNVIKETIEDGWFVWTRTGTRPRVCHHSREKAETEAQRLASLNPGKKFIVLQMVDKFHTPREEERQSC